MKKKVIMLSLLFSMMLYVGCGTADKKEKQNAVESDNTDVDFQSPRPDKEDVAVSANGVSDNVSSYGSIDALMADADAVVYGEAYTYCYMVENGTVYTIVTVRVLDSLYGDLQEGDEFTVFRSGGYVRLKDYLQSYEEQFQEQVRNSTAFADISDEDIETKYISFFPDGEVDTWCGDKSIFFLQKSGKGATNYYRVGSYEGEYVELSTGDFKVPGMESYDEVDNAAMEDSLESDGLSSCIISWDEIVDQVEN